MKPHCHRIAWLFVYLNFFVLGMIAVVACDAKAPQSSSVPVATLTPSKGPWHTFVRITGNSMGTVTGAQTIWYPNDDDTKPPLGSITTTLRSADPTNGAEIEIPADAGGPQGGVVRIMVTLRGEKEPLFAGRFTVQRDFNDAAD